jgi:hypothetical protein
MRKLIAAGLATLMAISLLAISADERIAAQDGGKKATAPKFLYGSNLHVRQGGKGDFDKDTPWIGIEVYRDEANNATVAISETGALSVIPGGQANADVSHFILTDSVLASLKSSNVPEAVLAKLNPLKDKEFLHDDFVKELSRVLTADEKEQWMQFISSHSEKLLKWLTGHDLSARKAGEVEFTQKTKKFGVELWRDLRSNKLLYGCESGSIAFAPVPGELVTDKGPRWHHGFEMRVRELDQKTFDNAKKFGVEVDRDENTGGLIYITQIGAIAAAPAPATAPDPKKIAAPKHAYGLNLRVRGANEPNFIEKTTKKIGLEVFEDPNANNLLIYITETGSIATAPNPGKFMDVKGVTWKSGMALQARKADEKSLDIAKKYGIEVFVDNRTGNLIFISETGSIAVLPKQ